MTEQEINLINAAVRMMGWTQLDKPIRRGPAEGTFFFWDTKSGNELEPIKAVSFPVSERFVKLGAEPFGFIWHRFNPLIDDAATLELMRAVNAAGHEISVALIRTKVVVNIFNFTEDINLDSVANTAGEAVCAAVLMLMSGQKTTHVDPTDGDIDPAITMYDSDAYPDGVITMYDDAYGEDEPDEERFFNQEIDPSVFK